MDVAESNQLTVDQAFHHWYYQAKFDLLTEHLVREKLPPDSQIADVGCGMSDDFEIIAFPPTGSG